MKNIELYIPKREDLWFRQKCMNDEKTMSYNAGYRLSFEGYHYETGCIDFPKENWDSWFNSKMTNSNFFYAYIKDKDTQEFVGYVNFNNNLDARKASMGIVIYSKFQHMGYMRPAMEELIKTAKLKGVKLLTDTVPNTRENALKVFFDLGFIKTNEFQQKKFEDIETVYEIEKQL